MLHFSPCLLKLHRNDIYSQFSSLQEFLMTELHLHNWVDVNTYMRDDYRLLVAAMAARQMASVEPELQALARTAFGSIIVPGARSFSKADLVQQRKALAKAMPGSPQIT